MACRTRVVRSTGWYPLPETLFIMVLRGGHFADDGIDGEVLSHPQIPPHLLRFAWYVHQVSTSIWVAYFCFRRPKVDFVHPLKSNKAQRRVLSAQITES